ncbi:MAG: glycosyltransferase family 39 protein [Anaerolineales bacterium]|jgi:hypothetical protein
MKIPLRRADRLALLIAVAGLFVTGFIAERVYERVPHIEDEFALLWQAEIMAQGDLYRPSPDQEKSFLIPFVVDVEGRRFGKYPPGWPAALSLGARLDAAGWINPLLSSVVLWFTYRLARKLLNPGLSLLAELLLLSSPMFLMLSGTYMSHMYSLLLTLGFMLAWNDLFLNRNPDSHLPRWLLICVAGGTIGLLFLTRPLTAAAVATPFTIHGVILLIRQPRQVWKALIAIGCIGLGIGTLLLLWQWTLSGDALTNLYTLWWPYDRIGFGLGHGVTESGHNLSLAYYNTRFSLRTGLHDLLGWPYLSWILLPFGLVGLYRKRLIWLFTAVFISLVIGYGLYWVGSWLFGPRYYFEAIPGLVILSAAGFGWLGGWLTGKAGDHRWRKILSLGVLSFLMLTNVLFYLPLRVGGMHGLYQIDRQSTVRFNAENPARTLIIVKAPHWFQYARYLFQMEPFSESPLLIAWSRGLTIDQKLANSYGERMVYYFDVETGALEPLQ